MKNVVITGANGFIGKNLCSFLENFKINVLKIDLENEEKLSCHLKNADFIILLAGINRTSCKKEFYTGNYLSVISLLKKLKSLKLNVPIIYVSSIQATLNNDYGKSKKKAEDLLFRYQKKYHNPVYIYRLPNVFGKWCRPNYNSVIATWCYNISNNLDIVVSDPIKRINFVYIDDVCKEFFERINSNNYPLSNKIFDIKPTYNISLGSIKTVLYKWHNQKNNSLFINLNSEYEKKLYNTFVSYRKIDDLLIPINFIEKDLESVKSKHIFSKQEIKPKNKIMLSSSYPNNRSVIVSKGCFKIHFYNCNNDSNRIFFIDKKLLIEIPIGYKVEIENCETKRNYIIISEKII